MRLSLPFSMNVPPECVFFTDRDLGKLFPAILKQAAIHVERHGDHFADDVKDEEWLRIVGQRDWYVLTHDKRIRYRPAEIAAVSRFKLGLFVIVGKAPLAELAQNFVFTLPKIIKFIEETPRPFIARIYRPEQASLRRKARASGYVKLWVALE